MAKLRKEFTISESLNEQLCKMANERGISQSEMINLTIHYYVRNNGRDLPELVRIFDAVVKENLNKPIKKIEGELTRVRHAVNETNLDCKINLELWNNHSLKHGDGNLIATNIQEAHELTVAESKVKGDLLIQQQMKHDRK